MAVSDFETNCLEDKNFKDSETTTRIGTLSTVSVSILSNLIHELVFLCKLHPPDSSSPFVDAWRNLASQNDDHSKLSFLDFGTTIKSKLLRIVQTIIQGYSHAFCIKAEDVISENVHQCFFKCQ